MSAATPGGCKADEIRVAWLDDSHVRVDFDGYIRHGHPAHSVVDGIAVDVAVHTQDP
jgi:hypothetical protein